jgi:tetratricopeptide (TPR) repeat protein
MERLTSPAAHARRAQLAKYVKAVVGVSLVVCFLAFVRIAIQRNHSTPQVGETSAMAATSPPAQTTPPSPATKFENAPEQAAQAAPQPADTPPAEPAATAAQPETADSRAGLGPVPTPEPSASPDEPMTPDPAEANKEKRKSHIALEQGKTDESIQHGELAVKLDPTDGEAWLILGAAYQSKGNWADARRCYRSCLTDGKRGPRGECSAMLR